jgi:hypothetical protein
MCGNHQGGIAIPVPLPDPADQAVQQTDEAWPGRQSGACAAPAGDAGQAPA